MNYNYYISSSDRLMIADVYNKIINDLNNKYYESYKLVDELNILYKNIVDISPAERKHAYWLGKDGKVFHCVAPNPLDSDSSDSNYFGIIMFDKDVTTLKLGSTTILFSNYRREYPIVRWVNAFESMMARKPFDIDEIISSYTSYKSLSKDFDKALKMFDNVFKEMMDFIGNLEKEKNNGERRIVEFFACQRLTM